MCVCNLQAHNRLTIADNSLGLAGHRPPEVCLKRDKCSKLNSVTLSYLRHAMQMMLRILDISLCHAKHCWHSADFAVSCWKSILWQAWWIMPIYAICKGEPPAVSGPVAIECAHMVPGSLVEFRSIPQEPTLEAAADEIFAFSPSGPVGSQNLIHPSGMLRSCNLQSAASPKCSRGYDHKSASQKRHN